jgi:hypothetical protein
MRSEETEQEQPWVEPRTQPTSAMWSVLGSALVPLVVVISLCNLNFEQHAARSTAVTVTPVAGCASGP